MQLVRILGVFLLSTFASLYFQENVLHVLSDPLHRFCPDAFIIVLSPQNYFYAIINVALWCGLVVVTPLLAIELVRTISGPESRWKIGLILFLAFAAGCFLGFRSLYTTMAMVCSSDNSEPLLTTVDQYFELARQRTFLYGLGMLAIASAGTAWWISRKQ